MTRYNLYIITYIIMLAGTGCSTSKCCEVVGQYLLEEQHARLEMANKEFKCSLDDLDRAVKREKDERNKRKRVSH